jgi:hypothetical protein
VRRSGRQSARDTPAAPSGPTVTASGRQVRSRATGLYGETLLSGQVTDHASPATGDYVRSDVSEEPQLGHGRSTRAAARGTTNGRALDRTLDSEDEEDATSWDGGDDDDEPDQMELDDDEDDAGEESPEEEDEPQSLMVTLRYGKGTIASSSAPTHDTMMANGVDHLSISSTGPPPAPAAPTPQHAVPIIPNDVAAPSQPMYTAPIVPAAHQQPPVGNPDALPQLDGFFSAPTPPYSAPEEAPKPQHPVTLPTSHAQVPPPQHSAPTPAASWQ